MIGNRAATKRVRRALAAAALVAVTGVGGVLVSRSLGEPLRYDARTRLAQGRIADLAELHWSFTMTDGAIAFANAYGEPGLFVADLTGGKPAVRRLEVRESFPRNPVISADGRRVIYRSFRDAESAQELYMVDLERNVTTTVAARFDDDQRASKEPAWAPDSREFVYVRQWVEQGWKSELRLVDVETGNNRVLFHDPEFGTQAPAWSPDGTRIAFLAGASLRILAVSGGDAPFVTRFLDRSPAPSANFADAPQWSPDGSTVAYSMTDGDCYRIVLVDTATGDWSFLDRSECAMRPAWSPDGERIAYVRLGRGSRTLWSRPTRGGQPRLEGFDRGIIYEYAYTRDGDLIATGMPADQPRAIWRIRAGAPGEPELLVASIGAPLIAGSISRPETDEIAAGDVRLPIRVFPRTCGEPRQRGPALVWVHGGPRQDVAPRWYQEIQYMAAIGLTVVAVNYRGSTGNGTAFRELADDRPGQVRDVLAAIEYARSRPDVDPDHVYVLHVSYSSLISHPAVLQRPDAVRGVVDWVGQVASWSEVLASGDEERRAKLAGLPPSLWISGVHDAITPARRTVIETLRASGATIESVELPAGHVFLTRQTRRAALEAVRDFVTETSAYRCRIAD